MDIEKDILATLTYFNLFEYPLKKGEIFIFLGHTGDMDDFEDALDNLLNESAVFKIGDFYSLDDNLNLAERRYKGNERAAALLKKAERAAALISAFPFVKGVAVSGSLSKHYADENADIDFFIITAANRLWIARTFLHIFKKFTFLFNMQELFCMNYFIDEAEPGIQEINIYTATEIATIMPLRGNGIFDKFFKVNSWTKSFFPNKFMYVPSLKEIKTTWLKFITEKILDNRFGNSMDNFLMHLTEKSWNSKTRMNKKNSKGMVLSMHIGKHFSKPSPDVFQKRLLQRYEKSLHEIYKRYELSRFC